MKVVWILNHYAVLPDEPGGSRHLNLARGLLAQNWQPVIFAASFGHWKRNQRLPGLSLYKDVELDAFKFRFFKTPGYRGNGVGRLLNMLCYFLVALLPASTRRIPSPDIIIGSSVHPLAALAGALLAKRHGVPFIFEIRDLWPETLVHMGRVKKNGLFTRFLYALEARLLRMADKVLVLLPHADRYLVQKGVPAEKISWLPNGVKLTEPRAHQAHSNDTVIMYLGAHGNANDLGTLLRAIRYLQQQLDCLEATFRFIGDGPAREAAIQMASDYQLKNVSFEEAIPGEEVGTKLSEADACFFAVADIPELYQYGISLNKIFDYMAASRPMIAALSSANNPVAEADAGLTVAAGEDEKLGKALHQFISMTPAERQKMGNNGRKYVEQRHDYAVLSGKLADLLNELCGQS